MKKNIIILSILIAVLAAFFASSHPDGLEKVAGSLGFIDAGVDRSSVMTDYTVPFVRDGAVSTSLAGLAGISLILLLFFGLGKIFKFRHETSDE